jgi:DivIVA domain-containing protein
VIWVLFIVVAILLIGAFAALVVGRVGYDPLSDAVGSQADPALAEDFHASDLADLHFDTALRGYRMDQVDAVLDRLQDRLAELESRARSASDSAPSDSAPSDSAAL